MHKLYYCVLLLLVSGGLNAQNSERPPAEGLAFTDVLFIPMAPPPSGATPGYPLDARRKSICGQVEAAVRIGLDGSVMEVKILKAEPPGIFDKAVLDAVRKWRYEPV